MDRNLLLFLAWCAGGLFFEGLARYLRFCKELGDQAVLGSQTK